MADLFRITVEGAGPSARAFDKAQRRLQDAIVREFRALGRQVEQDFEDVAPEDRGQIKDRLHAFVHFGRASRPQITVRTFARDPDSGYAYVRVTRFGHRKAVIFPKRAKALAVHYAGHRNPHIVQFAASVVGARPLRDWAQEGQDLSDRSVDDAMTRLGRRIDSGVL